jgi:hypothetical protein
MEERYNYPLFIEQKKCHTGALKSFYRFQRVRWGQLSGHEENEKENIQLWENEFRSLAGVYTLIG